MVGRGHFAEMPVLVLHYVQGASIARLAEGFGVSEGVVKRRMSRGRKLWRGSLEYRAVGPLERLVPARDSPRP